MDTLIHKFQVGIRDQLRPAKVEEGTKRAIEIESYFLHGAIWANPELIDHPTLRRYMLEQRSILDLEP